MWKERVRLHIEGNSYLLHPGYLALYNPGVYHQERWPENTTMCMFHVKFCNLHVSGMPRGDILPKDVDAVLDSGPYADFIRHCLDMMFDECTRKSVGYEQICQSLLESVIPLILRIISHHSALLGRIDSESLIARVKEYVAKNFHRKITIRDIADEMHISYYRLSHVFTERCGISLQNYLIDCRIKEAARLLSNTDRPIHDIANRSGYMTQSHFNMQFKQLMKLSPAQYRRQQREGGYGPVE